jgi:uncharacterized iron-regulated protein
MRQFRRALVLGAVLIAVPLVAASSPTAIAANPAALAQAMQGHRVILLGEVHDSGVQHALRAAALRQLVAGGARPALALEQFDRERQDDIDRARRERPGDPDYLIAQAKDARSTWQWQFYRPYIELALEYDLPIVAANLSRKDAMKVATGGWATIFDPAVQRMLGLDALPGPFLHAHAQAIAEGHCDLLPASALPAMAHAQIARDIALAQAISPYAAKGVVLLAGNGHVRRDIGVPHWLPSDVRNWTLGIGLLEQPEDGSMPAEAGSYDRYVLTAATARADPCKDLAPRLPALPAR